MQTIITVLKKELKDTLRDRKTLMSAILLPAIAIPLILWGVSTLQVSLMKKEKSKVLRIALMDAPDVFKDYLQPESFTYTESIGLEAAKDSVLNEDYDAILAFGSDFKLQVDSMGIGKVDFYYKSTNITVKSRVEAQLAAYKNSIRASRFQTLQIDPQLLEPIQITPINIASKQEQMGDVIGGMIPYVLILLCFMGCMYPALDLITGEKERGTIETLLTVPANRFHILMGKTITISLVGLMAATMAIIGLVVALNFINDIPASFTQALNEMVSMQFIGMLYAMLIPLSLFFAGVLSAVVVRASSFKEAQSYVTPMSFMVIIPAVIALMPGVELTWQTALVPILNVALATKEIVAGTINFGLYAMILLSLIAFAVGAVALSLQQFSKEQNILK